MAKQRSSVTAKQIRGLLLLRLYEETCTPLEREVGERLLFESELARSEFYAILARGSHNEGSGSAPSDDYDG